MSIVKSFEKINKGDKNIGKKHDCPSGLSYFSFGNGGCVEDYGPDSLFNKLPTVKRKLSTNQNFKFKPKASAYKR